MARSWPSVSAVSLSVCVCICVCVCALCPVRMQASGLHKGAEGAYTQMGKQSHCLLFCFLLCWERLVVIDLSQSGPGRVEASGKRSHQSPSLHTLSLKHNDRWDLTVHFACRARWG